MKTLARVKKKRIVWRNLITTAAIWLAIANGVSLGIPSAVYAQDDLTYKVYCARCHGDTGHGDGADAATFKTHPRDFTDCATMARVSDDTIFKAIKDGGAAVGLSGDMPAWGAGLDDDEIKGVMKHIRDFCPK